MVNAPKKQLPSWWKDGVSIYQVRLPDSDASQGIPG